MNDLRDGKRVVSYHLRPYRSAAIPKMVDPTERNISTRVIPQVICVVDLSNCFARSLTVRDTVKKSKASHVQAKKATRKNNHCWVFSWASNLNGLGALFMGGLRVDRRVAKYLPTDMCSSVGSICSSRVYSSLMCFSCEVAISVV